MFAMPGNPLCPNQSFNSYVSKCPEKAFYLHPKHIPDSQLNATQVWYAREPMGVNYFGNMLKMICEEVRYLGLHKS